MKIKNSHDYAISEVFGTVLLLLMVVSVFFMLFNFVHSDAGPEHFKYVTLVGRITGKNVILEHQGGEALPLDTDIEIKLADEIISFPVNDWLRDRNGNQFWNLGEQMIFPFEYNLSKLGDYDTISVQAIDHQLNTIDFMGDIPTKIYSDMGLEIYIDNQYPDQYDMVKITIIATSYGGDVNGSGNVKVSCPLPQGLQYVSDTTTQGSYTNETGIWNIGNVIVGSPAVLEIDAICIGVPVHQKVQLGMILDGAWIDNSFGTAPNKWNAVMLEGIKKAMRDENIFPHDGSVELTVVKYGYDDPPRPELVLAPTNISEDNYHGISADIRSTSHPRGHSPLASAFRFTADIMRHLGNFDPSEKQIILLISAGYPNCIWIPGGYNGSISSEINAQINATDAVEMINSTLEFDSDQDELNVIAVGKYGVNISFLNNSIPLPKPSYLAPPISSSGWVYNVSGGWKDFDDAINIVLKTLLNSIHFEIQISDSMTIDPNSNNDEAVIILNPEFV